MSRREFEPVSVVRRRGRAGDLHGLSIEEMLAGGGPGPPRPVVWWFDVVAPAVVVGGGRAIDVLDLEACRSEGLEVVRRGSGGGPVILEPGASLWVDVVVPAGDHRVIADVTESMSRFGDLWAEALAAVVPALAGRLTIHRGHQIHSEWSRQSCFAGLGPGEVLLDDRKLVGISQRRSRHGARYQCLLHRSLDPDRWRRVLRSPPAGDPPPIARWGAAGEGAFVETSGDDSDVAVVTAVAAAVDRWRR